MNLQYQLETLMKEYPYKKVTLLDDGLVYHGLTLKNGKETETELNQLIEKLGLGLVAKWNNTGNNLFSDTVLVQEKI